ncbi:MAG: hypothetical protein KC561_05545 [Myxococcales bacterium]|nr:hypothetical protein [Myxococcales bacterium]
MRTIEFTCNGELVRVRQGSFWLEGAWRDASVLAGADAGGPICERVGAGGLAEIRAALVVVARESVVARVIPPERASIRYCDGFGRGNPAGWWLLGRTLRISSAAGATDVDVGAVAEVGLPPEHGLNESLAESARAAAIARAELECACGTGAPSPLAHGDITELGRGSRPAPVEVSATVGECRVCGCRWTFSREGDTAYRLDEMSRLAPF